MDEHADGHGHPPAGENTGQQQHHGDQGDRDVLPHHGHSPLGQTDGFGQFEQVVAHQGDVRGLHGHG